MKKTVCVLIPVYKDAFSREEETAVRNNSEKLCHVKKVFVAPAGLNEAYYNKAFPDIKIRRFPDKYFGSVSSYNELMLSAAFYRVWKKYQYVLICQPDVWIIKNERILYDFCRDGYDYIGAPWYPPTTVSYFKSPFFIQRTPQYNLQVGNGGLSLRHVEHTFRCLKTHWLLARYWLWKGFHEDLFFSFIGEIKDRSYLIPAPDYASYFSLETNGKELIEKGLIPFGIHAYKKYYRKVSGIRWSETDD